MRYIYMHSKADDMACLIIVAPAC